MAHSDHIEKMKVTCIDLAKIEKSDTHALAAKLSELNLDYMKDLRDRGRHCFHGALLISIIGSVFFFIALYFMMKNTLQFPKLTLVAGTSIQLVSCIGFYIYARTTKEFFAFHAGLERLNRFLLANTICEKLDLSGGGEMRKKLVEIMASAPPLSMSLIEGGRSEADQIETEAATTTAVPRELVTTKN